MKLKKTKTIAQKYKTMELVQVYFNNFNKITITIYFRAFFLGFSGFFRLFFWVRIRIQIGQKSGSDPEKSESGSVKKRPKTEV